MGGMTSALKQAFPPSIDAQARLLVLGSLPGEESLRRGEYYAHPTNAFWWLIGEVIGADLVHRPYPDRLVALRQARIGLWDVIERAERAGSLDAAIRLAEHRDLAAFAATLPDLRAIAFNGATAHRHGTRQLGATALTLIALPSSSPLHTVGLAAKLPAWAALHAILD